MLLSVVDECNEYEKSYKLTDIHNIKQLVEEAERLGFDCLAFISFDEITIFNQLQMHTILKEIDILRKQGTVDEKLIDQIDAAITIGIKDYMYLKFEPSI